MRSFRHVKRIAGVALVLTSVLAGQALGASQVAYTLELGGNNHADAWKIGTRTLYTRGSAADGQVFYNGDLLNYAVVLEASGIHSQPGHPSDGKEIFGAANVVFNLEFLDGNNQPVGNVVYTSTANDGTAPDGRNAKAAFALSFNYFATGIGRLIDPVNLGGPRFEPIFTYPAAPTGTGTLIGQGAGYKEWERNGSTDILTFPGIGMVTMPGPDPNNPNVGRRPSFGVVPVAEGQIDISLLTPGTYKLKVVPGNGNNVLRGDVDMYAGTDRPAFAVAANQTVGDEIIFTVSDEPPPQPCVGVVGRHILYNNSKWDNFTPGVTSADWAAIAPDKYASLPGSGDAVPANWITYSKSINCIVIDACHFNRVPVAGLDIAFLMGNTTDPFSFENAPSDPNIQLFPGEGANGSDRLVLTWPDNAIPNTHWLVIALFAGDPSLGLPEDDLFAFGVAIGDGNGDLNVNAADEAGCRPPNTHNFLDPAPIDDAWDYNRDRFVNAQDEVFCRPPYVTNFLNSLKRLNW